MEHRHLDAAALEHLLAADRTAKQTEQLFHLLAVCPRCREVGGWLLELHQANALPPVFGPIDAALARSRAEASRLLEELRRSCPPVRLRGARRPRMVVEARNLLRTLLRWWNSPRRADWRLRFASAPNCPGGLPSGRKEE